MSEGGALAVVIAPETSEEAGRLFAALLSAGFHPTMDYGGEARLANYPILAPQGELAEAKAFVSGLKAGRTEGGGGLQALFGANISDRPAGPIPPWRLRETVGKALGVLVAMLVLVGGVTGLVLALQFLGSLARH